MAALKPILPTLAPSPSLVSRLRASSWPPVLLKLSAIGIALLLLAWIGRTAAAGPTSPVLAPLADVDAGAAPVVASPEVADAAPPAPPLPVVIAPPTSAQATPEQPVFLNHATVDDLKRLPGVGPKRAEQILVLRQKLGRFSRVEDLQRVKGIGRKTIKKWRPLVRLDSPTADVDGGQ